MDHSATMRSAYERINAGDLAGFGALLADDFVEHEDQPDLDPTKEGVLAWFAVLRNAFPDLQMHVEDLLASGDKTVARVKLTGTHRAEFMGIPPTGKRVDIALIDIMRFNAAGLVCEHWGVADVMAMMQQLGVIPAGPPA
jgi:steroid delta-isomerase-like uncharacterized protein